MTEAKTSNKDYNLPFPARLRFLLDEKGKGSQSQLADYIGVTRQAISAYSLGNSVPDIYKFQKMAEFFDVPLEFMLGESDNRERENIDIGKATGLSDKVIHNLKSYINGDMKTDYIRFMSVDRTSILNSFLEDNDFPLLLDCISSLIGDRLVYEGLALAMHEEMLPQSTLSWKTYKEIDSLLTGTVDNRTEEAYGYAQLIIDRIVTCYIDGILDKPVSIYINEQFGATILDEAIETLERENAKQNGILQGINKLLQNAKQVRHILSGEVTENGDDHEKK